MVRGEALEGRRGPGAGEVGRYSYPGEARPGVRQSTPRKAKDGWAETLSRRLQGPGRQNWRWAGVKDGSGGVNQLYARRNQRGARVEWVDI